MLFVSVNFKASIAFNFIS